MAEDPGGTERDGARVSTVLRMAHSLNLQYLWNFPSGIFRLWLAVVIVK